MDLHSKFNIGDKVYLIDHHGTMGSGKPFYIMSEVFKDKNGKDEFEIESVKIEAGKGYCNIDYRFKNFHEIFIPSEYNIYSDKDEALKICKQNNINNCKRFKYLRKYLFEEKRNEKEKQLYEDEIKRLESL